MPTLELSQTQEIVRTPQYEKSDNIAIPVGTKPVPLYSDEKSKNIIGYDNTLTNKITSGQITTSVINKLHLIKLANDYPFKDSDIPNKKDLFQVRSVADLCRMNVRGMEYDIDDFLYCKNCGFPVNHLITLRRYPYPCTDNIWDKTSQGEPDIARMVTYFSQETNKLDDILSFSYGLKWKELTAEMEQATMQGEQTGLSGFMKSAAQYIDPALWGNKLRGENANMYDPKHDQNKVYGPVDSITNTHIRDVGFEFEKEFEITFEYEMRSINGRTPEYAMKDIIGNILACTYNNGKFWPGSRYWVGERPSKFTQHFQYLNSDNIDNILNSATKDIKSALKMVSTKSSAIELLKDVMRGGFAIALGKMLDRVGRPGIMTVNSLLSGEPTGLWHLTIGNPVNPIMCIGNLLCTGVSFDFPTDNLSYGDFPTKLVVKVKLKPGMAKDRAGIEMMFNMGKHRIYYAPKSVKRTEGNGNDIARTTRKFYNGEDNESKAVDNLLDQTYDFISEGVKSVTTTFLASVQNNQNTNDKTGTTTEPTSKNISRVEAKRNRFINADDIK